MRKSMRNRSAFIAKSMLWSLLFYSAFMLVVNWDEISGRLAGKSITTVISSSAPSPHEPSVHIIPSCTGKQREVPGFSIPGAILATDAMSGIESLLSALKSW